MPDWRGEIRTRLADGRAPANEDDVIEELAQHLDDRYRELMDQGADASAARDAVLQELAGPTPLADDLRRARGMAPPPPPALDGRARAHPITDVLRDAHYALRSLRRTPGFAAVAIVTLALGIGANTAIFTVVNAVLLRPLPYPEPGRLVTMQANQSLADVVDVTAAARSFDAGGAVNVMQMDYIGGEEPTQVKAGLVNAGLFDALGVRPALGRAIARQDDAFGGPHLAVLLDGFWHRAFGADPRVLGRGMRIGGQSYTITGVMPPGFALPEAEADVLVAMRVAYPAAAHFRGVHFARSYWRLKPGLELAQAQAEMEAIDRRLAREYPDENKGRATRLEPLGRRVSGDVRPALLVLFGAVGLVLIIACVNFASLLLARSTSRQPELFLRAALGAGQGRLVRQLLTESVVLALAGGIAGVGLAHFGVRALLALEPGTLARFGGIGVDRVVLLFAVGLSALTGVAFGVAPALNVVRPGADRALRAGGGRAGASRRTRRLRGALVIGELALALVLLAGAALLVQAFWRLRSIEPGFDPRHVVTIRLQLPESRYAAVPEQTVFRRSVLDGLNAVSGVQAAMISEIPLGGESVSHNCIVDGEPPVAPGDAPEIQTRSVMGDYFRVMRMPLRAGRAFDGTDHERAPRVAVINEAAARRFFPHRTAVGARIRWANETPARWFTVVGVVGDVRHFGLARPDEPALYNLYYQDAQPWKRWMQLVIRTDRAPGAVVRAVKQQVWKADPEIAVTGVRPMDEIVATSMAADRFSMVLLAVFATLAVSLAAVGLYGLVSYLVSLRTREIGIRMALGAASGDVVALVVRRVATLAGAGVVLGLAGAIAFSRMLSRTLDGVGSAGMATFAGSALVLLVVAFAASLLPARRAARVDPTTALRCE